MKLDFAVVNHSCVERQAAKGEYRHQYANENQGKCTALPFSGVEAHARPRAGRETTSTESAVMSCTAPQWHTSPKPLLWASFFPDHYIWPPRNDFI
jgi:hypothetical protein